MNRLLIWAEEIFSRLLARLPIPSGQVWVKGKVANYNGQDAELILADLEDGHPISVFIGDFEDDMRVAGQPEFIWSFGMECHAKGRPTFAGGKVVLIDDLTELVVLGD